MLIETFYNASLKKMQHAKLWKKFLTNARDFDLKKLQCVNCWNEKITVFHKLQKTMQSRNHVLFRSTLYKWESFADFVLFKKIEYEIEN